MEQLGVQLMETPVFSTASDIVAVMKIVGYGLSVVFLVLGVYFGVLSSRQGSKDRKAYNNHFLSVTRESVANPRWPRVVQLFQSPNSQDWRIAVIEADSMLEDLLIRLGYQGESLAGRMRSIEPSDFPTLQLAWEAHLVRNKIAHEGLNYQLSREEANRVYRLYEAVFHDAKYI